MMGPRKYTACKQLRRELNTIKNTSRLAGSGSCPATSTTAVLLNSSIFFLSICDGATPLNFLIAENKSLSIKHQVLSFSIAHKDSLAGIINLSELGISGFSTTKYLFDL